MNHAKNATSRVSEIVRLAREAGLISQGVLSIQTRDPNVLQVVNRKNISPKRYDDLLGEFRRSNLPVHTEIMMALPGSTYATFADDLQWACDKMLTAHVAWTMVLPNTPMADPDYMSTHDIRTAEESPELQAELTAMAMNPIPPNTIVASRSFTRADFIRMAKLSSVYHLLQGEAIVKHVMYYLARQHGIRQVKFLEIFSEAPLRMYPLLHALRDWKVRRDSSKDLLSDLVIDNRWTDLYTEVRRYVSRELGLKDAALETVIQLQQFLMAFAGRSVPESIDLPHDFIAYKMDARYEGSALSDLGPGTVTVADPGGVCAVRSTALPYEPHCGTFELDSELSVSRVGPLVGLRGAALLKADA
jgi:hypothetical protein